MSTIFLSTISPPPAGFVLAKPTRKDLLSRIFAVYTHDPGEIMALVESRITSVKGVVICPAADCTFEQLGQHFWQLNWPTFADKPGHLLSLLNPLLNTLESYTHVNDQNFDLQRRLTRTSRDLAQAQQDYQRATSALVKQVQNLTVTESRLRSSEAHLKHIIDLLPQQIYAVDDKDNMILANQSYADAYALAPEVLLGKSADEIARLAAASNGWHAHTDQANAQVRLDNARIDMTNHVLETGAGTHFFHVTKIPFHFSSNEEQLGVLTVATDITRHKEAEQAIRQLNQDLEQRVSDRTADLARANASLHDAKVLAEAANASKSLFLAMMSHEIRTPMNGVVGMIDLLRETALNHDQQKMLNTIRESSFVLLNLLDDILDFSKIEAGRLELEQIPFSLSEILESVAETLMPNAMVKQLQFSCFVHPEIPDQLLGDPVRLRQVLFNLCGNAIKFTEATADKRGQVQLRAELAQLAESHADIILHIEDDGIGMSAESINKLFEPFTQAESSTTRHYGGTGLGLSICRRLVDMMDGSISVSSEPGAGSCFKVFLSLQLAHQQEPSRARQLQDVEVVAVLPSSLLRRNLEDYLAFWGVKVHVVDTLPQAEKYIADLATFAKPVLILGPAWPAPSQVLAHLQTLLLTFRHDRASTNASLPSSMIRVWISPLRREDLFLALSVASGKAKPQAIGISPKDAPAHAVTLLSYSEAEEQNRLILVAEDNPVNQKVIEKQLAHLGHTCMLAENGRIAFELWRQHKFALVISDCHMPEMDGFALTQAIRDAETPDVHVPIIAFTANALRGETERCLLAGMDDYLSKPVEMQALRRTLHKWLPLPPA